MIWTTKTLQNTWKLQRSVWYNTDRALLQKYERFFQSRSPELNILSSGSQFDYFRCNFLPEHSVMLHKKQGRLILKQEFFYLHTREYVDVV